MSTLAPEILNRSAGLPKAVQQDDSIQVQPPRQRHQGKHQALQRRNYWQHENPDYHCQIPKHNPLPYLLESKLFALAQQGDVDARNTLWLQHARLAFSMINHFSLPSSMLADVLQEGILTLRHAIARFDVHRYNAFSTYAWHWVRQGMQRYLQNHRFRLRMPAYLYQPYCRFRHLQHHQVQDADRPDAMPWYREWQPDEYVRFLDFNRINDALPLHEHLHEVPCECEIDETEDETVLHSLIPELLRCLKFRSAVIIRLRFGMDGQPPQTLQEIGTQMNLTRERVRQIEAKAIKRLRKQMKLLLKQDKYQSLFDHYGSLPETDE